MEDLEIYPSLIKGTSTQLSSYILTGERAGLFPLKIPLKKP